MVSWHGLWIVAINFHLPHPSPPPPIFSSPRHEIRHDTSHHPPHLHPKDCLVKSHSFNRKFQKCFPHFQKKALVQRFPHESVVHFHVNFCWCKKLWPVLFHFLPILVCFSSLQFPQPLISIQNLMASPPTRPLKKTVRENKWLFFFGSVCSKKTTR